MAPLTMRGGESDRLYRALKNRICERIFRGDYADGDNLPPERTLAQSLGISRVTVRRALDLLAADGIIERLQGSGNRVRLSLAGRPGAIELVAVVARAQNVFFSSFIDRFQRTAEERDALVLFKQVAAGERLEDSLFKLLQKNIRNAVIWLEDLPVDREAIRRLRGLGMNLVFFDVVAPSPYADGVLVDNADAIDSLLRALASKGHTAITYVGWDPEAPASAAERESAFLRLYGMGASVQRIAWRARDRLDEIAATLIDDLKRSGSRPQALLCGDGEIGVAMRKALIGAGLASIDVASPDDYPQSRALAMIVYRQDFGRMAEKTYQCLIEQNQPGWIASTWRVKGELLVAEAAEPSACAVPGCTAT